MIKYNNKTINDWYFDSKNVIKVYKNNAVCYYKIVSGGVTPSQEPCFAVVEDISSYQDREFEDVYDKATSKWYKLNNLNQYEQYGVYGEGRNITYYKGKLTIDEGYEFEWDGSQWVNLGEVEDGTILDNYIIEFADSTVKQLCVSNWGGNVYTGELTYGEAKQVTSLGSVFKSKTAITSFNELAYFHGLTSLVNGEFAGCTNLMDIVIPSNITTIGYNSSSRATFSGCTNLSGLTILSGDETIKLDLTANSNSYYMNSSHSATPMVFPNRNITMTNSAFAYYDYLTIVYFQSATPPANLANADINNYRKLTNVYCPVGSLSAYQTALAGKNKTIAEYDFETDSLGLLNKEKEWISKTSSVSIFPKYYESKTVPPDNITFATLEDALAYECPWVGMNVTIDNTQYLFGDAYEWLTKYGLFEVSGEYICQSGDKYMKMEEKVRNIDGTWSSQSPVVYEKGDLIEAGSEDCQGDIILEWLECGGDSTRGGLQLLQNVTTDFFYVVDVQNTTATFSSDYVIIGQKSSVEAVSYQMGFAYYSGNMYLDYGGGRLNTSINLTTQQARHTYSVGHNTPSTPQKIVILVDGVQMATANYASRVEDLPYLMGGVQYTGHTSSNVALSNDTGKKMKIWSVKIYTDCGQTLVGDYIPVRKEDGTVTLYDKVSGGYAVTYGKITGSDELY